jgi:subfamily B ATP-binding cassette protein MsbA
MRPDKDILRALGHAFHDPAFFSGMEREFQIFSKLVALAGGQLRFLPLMAVLALLTSIFEGISLTLVIPLVQALDEPAEPQSYGGFVGLLHHSLAAIPVESRVLAILTAILAAVLVKSAVSYANMAVLGVVYGRLSHKLRTSIFATIVARPLAEVERERLGKLLNILNNETWRATDALNCLFTMITSLMILMVFVTLLFLLSWQLAFIAVLCMGFIPPVIHLIARRAKKLSELGLVANETLAQQTWSTFNGLRTIHVFGREGLEVERFNESSDKVRHLFLRMALISMTTGPITEVFVTGVVGLLALVVTVGQIGVSTLAGFLVIVYRLQPRLFSLVSAQTSLLGLHASISAVTEVLSLPAPPNDAGALTPFTHMRHGVSFQGVTFSYDGAPSPALLNISFEARKGSVVAIVGASGAGKSTLLDLILRFQEPQLGSILVDGVPLREIEPTSWRSRIAVVTQDPYIFDDTVGANILFGRLDATENELIEAARLACADSFVRDLPKGYDTIVGERGTQISGGQRQRIALARALIRDPDMILLDEATNALDTLTERTLQEVLRRFAETRVVIVVAHRHATIEHADHVIVLNGGKLVEQGPPQALLRADGLFTAMFTKRCPPVKNGYAEP